MTAHANEQRQGSCPVLHYQEECAPGPSLEYYRKFDRLREEAPVLRGDIGDFWALTRYDDVKQVLMDSKQFSNSSTIHLDPDPSYKWIPENLDPPEHSAWRKLLNPIFSPARVAAMENSIRQTAIDYIEEIKPAGRCDFLADFAGKFPTKIFMDLMGLPASETDRFVAWEDATVRAEDWSDQEAIGKVVGEILAYLQELISERRAHPVGDDILSLATQWKIDGQPVTDEDLQSLCLLLFMAGLDTVTYTLSTATLHLANNLDQQAQLRGDPAIIPSAVEEFVRYFSPVGLSRKVTVDTEIQGCPMTKGQMIWLPLWIANQDGRARENADQVVLDRTNNNHVGFGAGTHRCVGQHLARLEMRIALEEWHRLIPEYRQDSEQTSEQRVSANMTIDRIPLVWEV